MLDADDGCEIATIHGRVAGIDYFDATDDEEVAKVVGYLLTRELGGEIGVGTGAP